jgi:hypothetical protein
MSDERQFVILSRADGEGSLFRATAATKEILRFAQDDGS